VLLRCLTTLEQSLHRPGLDGTEEKGNPSVKERKWRWEKHEQREEHQRNASQARHPDRDQENDDDLNQLDDASVREVREGRGEVDAGDGSRDEGHELGVRDLRTSFTVQLEGFAVCGRWWVSTARRNGGMEERLAGSGDESASSENTDLPRAAEGVVGADRVDAGGARTWMSGGRRDVRENGEHSHLLDEQNK
jgi:hypothetical protein